MPTARESPLRSGGGVHWTEFPAWPMLGHMPKDERRVKLFRNGRNQAVRIPREFELPGEDAVMRREGDRLIIEPARPRSLLAYLATLDPLEEDFLPIEDLPIDPIDL